MWGQLAELDNRGVTGENMNEIDGEYEGDGEFGGDSHISLPCPITTENVGCL